MIQLKVDTRDGTIGEILALLHIPAVKIDRRDEAYPLRKTSFDKEKYNISSEKLKETNK
jgi:hypothetical protein